MLFQCTVGVFLEFKRVLLFIARSNSSRSLYRSVSGCMLNHSDIRYRLFTNILEQSFSIDLMAWGGNWYVRILSRSQSTCGLRRSFTCNSILLFYAPVGVSHCTSFSFLLYGIVADRRVYYKFEFYQWPIVGSINYVQYRFAPFCFQRTRMNTKLVFHRTWCALYHSKTLSSI